MVVFGRVANMNKGKCGVGMNGLLKNVAGYYLGIV